MHLATTPSRADTNLGLIPNGMQTGTGGMSLTGTGGSGQDFQSLYQWSTNPLSMQWIHRIVKQLKRARQGQNNLNIGLLAPAEPEAFNGIGGFAKGYILNNIINYNTLYVY